MTTCGRYRRGYWGLAGLAAAGLLTAAPAAQAGNLPAGGVTRQEVAAWLAGHGRRADLHADSQGEKIVSSTINEVNFDIYFFACDPAGRCGSIQYAAGWSGLTITPDKLNSWNTDKRFIRSYVKPTGAVWGEYDVDISPGGPWEQLDKSLQRWGEQVTVFKTYIGG